MLYKLPIMICLLIMHAGKAQSPAFDIMQYIDRLPVIDINNPAFKQYENSLQAQITLLADRSQHKSRLLSMLAGRYDEESGRYDFTKAVFAKDAELTKKQEDVTRAFMYELDNFQRFTSGAIDSIRNTKEAADVQAKKMLHVYQQAFTTLVIKVKKQLAGINEFMNKKGYNTALNNLDQTHKYYIQLLEVRGLLLDRLRQLALTGNGVVQMVVRMMQM